MLLDDARTPFGVAPRLPWRWLRHHIDLTPGVDGQKPEAQEATELLDARVVLPAAPSLGGADGEPDFVASGRAINGLKHQLQREASFHLADNHDFGRSVGKGDEIAAAHLALHLPPESLEMDFYPESLEMDFYRPIEVGFQ